MGSCVSATKMKVDEQLIFRLENEKISLAFEIDLLALLRDRDLYDKKGQKKIDALIKKRTPEMCDRLKEFLPPTLSRQHAMSPIDDIHEGNENTENAYDGIK